MPPLPVLGVPPVAVHACVVVLADELSTAEQVTLSGAEPRRGSHPIVPISGGPLTVTVCDAVVQAAAVPAEIAGLQPVTDTD